MAPHCKRGLDYVTNDNAACAGEFRGMGSDVETGIEHSANMPPPDRGSPWAGAVTL